jgi:cysteine-rich repeat protein
MRAAPARLHRTFGSWLAVAVCVAAAGCGSDSGPSPQPTPTPQAVCGNGLVETGEECDDANAVNSDGCMVTCRRPASFVASDVHAHTTGCSRSFTPESVAAQFKAQGIQVVASLVWGTGFADDAPSFTGRDHPLSTSGFILHYDMEVSHSPAATTGHLMLLGLDSLRFSDDIFATPSSGLPVADWARRQPRAVVGMAHGEYWPADGSFPVPPGGCCVPWEVVVQATRGGLSFLSVERMPMDAAGAGAFVLWKALLNVGFRVAITGGSAWGCLTHVYGDDTPRTVRTA